MYRFVELISFISKLNISRISFIYMMVISCDAHANSYVEFNHFYRICTCEHNHHVPFLSFQTCSNFFFALNIIHTRSFFIFFRFLVSSCRYVDAFRFLILGCFVDISIFSLTPNLTPLVRSQKCLSLLISLLKFLNSNN